MPIESLEHPTAARPQPADVGRAIAAALVTGGSTAQLERLVRDYGRALRNAHVPPKHALPRVKDMDGVVTVTPDLGAHQNSSPRSPRGGVSSREVKHC